MKPPTFHHGERVLVWAERQMVERIVRIEFDDAREEYPEITWGTPYAPDATNEGTVWAVAGRPQPPRRYGPLWHCQRMARTDIAM